MEVKRASSATILKVVIVLLSVLIVALVVFAAATLVTIWSLIDYFKRNISVLKDTKKS